MFLTSHYLPSLAELLDEKCLQATLVKGLAFPYHHHGPTGVLQERFRVLVALRSLGEFLSPEVRLSLRYSCDLATGVLVPKASVHEYCGLMTRQHDVGLARQITPMQPKPQA